VVRDLVRGIAESGQWAETHRTGAAKVVAPYFRQDEKLLNYVLTTPPNRVSYAMLNPSDKDIQKIADMALKMGLLKQRMLAKDILDRRFIPKHIKPAKIDPDKP